MQNVIACIELVAYCQLLPGPVTLSLKTLFCLKTVLRQFLRCFGLGLGLVLLVLSWNLLTQLQRKVFQNDLDCFTKSDAILAKYLATINHDDFYAAEQTNVFASHEYSSLDHCSADCSLCACNISPCRTFFCKNGWLWNQIVPRWVTRCWNC